MFRTLAILILLAAAPAMAQSTADMTAAAVKDFKEADAALNAAYKQLLPKLAPGVKAKLEASESAWLKFRDSDSDARGEVNRGGTIRPMVELEWKAYLTRARTDELKEWLKQTE